MPIPLSQRPWLVRFAWAGVVVLFLLTPFVTYVLWCHASGMRDLQRVQESHAKEGRGSTIQDLLADIPDSDPDRHERWWRWQGSLAAHEHGLQTFFVAWESDDARKWKLGLGADVPTTLTDAFDQVRDVMPVVEALLDEGPFIAGMAGTIGSTFRPDDPDWLLRAFSEFQHNDYEWKAGALLHLVDLDALHFLTCALEYRVLSADSPAARAQALRRMDRLVDVLAHPVGMLETMLLLMATTRRDDAYLGVILRRSLPENEFTTWLADDRSSRSLPLIAQALKEERLMRLACLGQLVHNGGLHRFEMYGIQVFSRLDAWMAGPAGLALCCDAMADAERRIERGPSHVLNLDRWIKSMRENRIAHLITPNLVESAITASQSRFIARRTRIIAVILRHAQSSGSPPGLPEVRLLLGPHADWLDPSDDHCAMSYSHVTADRFRVGVDLVRSTDGVFTPLVRYRPSTPSTYRSPRGTPAPPRTDLPPKSVRTEEVEVWIPRPASE